MPTSLQEKAAAIALTCLFTWLVWWFPWSRIAKRSGFRGRRYWVIMHMVGTAPIVAFGVVSVFGPTSSMANAAAPLLFGLYLGLWLLAISPLNKNIESR